MGTELSHARTLSKREAEVVGWLEAERRRSLTAAELRATLGWSDSVTWHVLSRLARKGWLCRTARGRYETVLADTGGWSVPNPWAALSAWEQRYYVGFKSAAYEHQLTTDRPSSVQACVSVGARKPLAWGGIPIVLIFLPSFQDEGVQVEKLHSFEVRIASVEKTLVDAGALPGRIGGLLGLARAVDRVSRYEFPVQLADANRSYFSGMAPLVGGAKGAAMMAVVKDSNDSAAVAVLDQDPNWHAMLRTTCVATMLSAGHATNALPQRARANINCRIFPGVPREEIMAQLVRIADDPAVAVSIPEVRGPVAAPAPLTPRILGPIETVAQQMWPGVPVVPALEPGASDAQFLNPAGIPTYGITGLFTDADGGRIHGLNERIRIRSVYEGRSFLFQLVKRYADQ